MNKTQTAFQTNLHRFTLSMLLVSMVFLIGCSSLFVSETPVVTKTLKPTSSATMIETSEMSPTPGRTATQPIPVTLTIQPEDLAGTAIKFMHPWVGEGAKTIKEIAMQFSLSNPWDIWVDVEGMGSESLLVESLETGLETGDLPNLIAVHPYQLAALGDAFVTINLTDYLNDPEWGLTPDDQLDIPEVFLDPFMIDGDLIALPIAPLATVLFFNQTWAEELGYPSPPLDDDDFRQYSCSATFANLGDDDEENDGTGGYPRNLAPNVLASWFYTFGGQLPAIEKLTFNNQAGREAFNYLKSLDAEGCIWINRKPEPYLYFAERHALMYGGTLDQIPALISWMDVVKNEDRWTVIGFPGSGGQTISIDGPGLMITASYPENQLAAWLFARYLLEPEVQAKLVQSMFSLPVRQSAIDSLDDFVASFPQWAAGVAMIENAKALPVSETWGIAQWALQDAIFRLLQTETSQTEVILAELDEMISELEGTVP